MRIAGDRGQCSREDWRRLRLLRDDAGGRVTLEEPSPRAECAAAARWTRRCWGGGGPPLRNVVATGSWRQQIIFGLAMFPAAVSLATGDD